ncbi:MAG: formimidoylglutamase [Bacteroidetes bacterium]|nr:formimidoylglutamase [Bacteroidota bacterium]
MHKGMDISFFFDALNPELFDPRFRPNPHALGNLTQKFVTAFPDWTQADLVLFGIREDRGSADDRGCARAADQIRDRLYQLSAPRALKICDLGNLVQKAEPEEVQDALQFVAHAILKRGKTLMVIGGTQDLSYGLYRGFEQAEQQVDLVAIDARLDIWDSEVALTNESVNHAILTHEPNYLHHFSVIGAQNHLVSETERNAMQQLNYDILRIGELKADLRLAEPLLRTAHMVSYDLSAIRLADAPAASNSQPAGLSAEEACQLARYAGMGYHPHLLHLCEVNPVHDHRLQTSTLAALLAWYFIEGYYNRIEDRPVPDRSNLRRYRVPLDDWSVPEILFYKHEASERWWMEVLVEQPGTTHRRPSLVPCAEADYSQALAGEIPDRWWKAQYRG